MVKGAQKQMVVIKTADSQVFEEAYFVVRRGAGTGQMDMLAEANRIIESCGIGSKSKPKIDFRQWMFALCSFVGGGTVGALIVGFIFFAS